MEILLAQLVALDLTLEWVKAGSGAPGTAPGPQQHRGWWFRVKMGVFIQPQVFCSPKQNEACSASLSLLSVVLIAFIPR